MSCTVLAFALAVAGEVPPEPGAVGGSGLALIAAKILTVPYDGPQFVDRGDRKSVV